MKPRNGNAPSTTNQVNVWVGCRFSKKIKNPITMTEKVNNKLKYLTHSVKDTDQNKAYNYNKYQQE